MEIRAELVHENAPVLRQIASCVEIGDPGIPEIVRAMKGVLRKNPGLAIAAPQIGVSKRIVVLSNGRVLLNPKIVDPEGKQRSREGCLSLPHRGFIVTRPRRAKIVFTDLTGKIKKMKGAGRTAAMFCHEVDHLNGILISNVGDEI